MSDTPPLVGWFVVEADVADDRDNEFFATVRGPFESRERAEQERDQQQDAWERALEEWDGENPYVFKDWNIVEKHISDFQLDQLERMDEDRHETMTAAADAVAASMLVKDGIGPLAEDL